MTQLRVAISSSLEFWLDHAAASERVLQLLHEVATVEPRVLTEPAVFVVRTRLSDCARHVEAHLWTAPFGEAESVLRQLALALQRAFTAADIVDDSGHEVSTPGFAAMLALSRSLAGKHRATVSDISHTGNGFMTGPSTMSEPDLPIRHRIAPIFASSFGLPDAPRRAEGPDRVTEKGDR